MINHLTLQLWRSPEIVLAGKTFHNLFILASGEHWIQTQDINEWKCSSSLSDMTALQSRESKYNLNNSEQSKISELDLPIVKANLLLLFFISWYLLPAVKWIESGGSDNAPSLSDLMDRKQKTNNELIFMEIVYHPRLQLRLSSFFNIINYCDLMIPGRSLHESEKHIKSEKILNNIFSGIFFVLPCIETYQKVDLRTITLDVPPQEVGQN